MIHGGDIYHEHIELDFSVNVDPYGPLPEVLSAMHRAVDHVTEYPEYGAARLRAALAGVLGADERTVIPTAGASEAFLALAQAVRPRTGMVQAPSFYGYEYALESVGAGVRKERDPYAALSAGASSGAAGSGWIPEIYAFNGVRPHTGPDLVFYGNPNNPTGLLTSKADMTALADRCRETGSILCVDECFLVLAGAEESSLIPELKRDPERFGHVVIARSFTKTFAIPGVRLGYLVCADGELAARIRRCLPEWNISGMAQEAGLAALGTLDETRGHVRMMLAERARFAEALAAVPSLKVFPGAANYILIEGPEDLKDRLLAKAVLIRDCGNFTGLESAPGRRHFRLAVRRPEENERLLGILNSI